MEHDDVMSQLLSGMRVFLAESALVHAHAAAARLDPVGELHPMVLDFASSAARLRARGNSRPTWRHQRQVPHRTC